MTDETGGEIRDLLDHPGMPLRMNRDENGGYNLYWNGTRAGFLEETRNRRLEMLLILEHPDGAVIQHSASYRNREEALTELRRWVPTRAGKEIGPEDALLVRAAFKR